MKNLIINADDFGIAADANKAIVDLFKKGVVSSATLMTTMGQSSSEAVELAQKNKIPVGLHFNLTLKNEKYKNRRDFEMNFIFGRVSRSYVEKELAKQYSYLVQNGLKPTHIDSHQHIHNWPGMFRIVANFAKEKGISVRVVEEWPIRNTLQKVVVWDLKQLFRKSIFLMFAKINKIQAKMIGIKTNKKMVSLFALWPRPDIFEDKHIKLVLNKVKNNSEYMCHPVVSARTIKELTTISRTSVQEYDLMTKNLFFDMIKKNKIRLIDYSKI